MTTQMGWRVSMQLRCMNTKIPRKGEHQVGGSDLQYGRREVINFPAIQC